MDAQRRDEGHVIAATGSSSHPGRTASLLLALGVAVAGSVMAGENVHLIRSPRQGGETVVRILTPDEIGPTTSAESALCPTR